MRPELLDYIKCPVCQRNYFLKESIKIEGKQVSEGRITCKKCNNVFLIKNGVVFLYEKLSQAAKRELEAQKNEINKIKNLLAFQNENWLLNYPKVVRIGVDNRSERIGRLNSENIILSLRKYLDVSGKSILEIGAGNCWVTAVLSKKNYCIATDILTIFPKGLAAGQAFIKNGYNFDRVVADMIDLPFRDSVFDYIVISSSLHHSSDIDKTLDQVSRVLKDSGRVIILNEPSLGMFGGKERRRLSSDRGEGFNESRFHIREWRRLLSGNNFLVKISLPENTANILYTKNGFFKIISPIFKLNHINKLASFLAVIILYLFDGFFNAILIKTNK